MRLGLITFMMLAACDQAQPAPAKPPSCLFLDASIPAPRTPSKDPSVFLLNECNFIDPCEWACSHDGVHIIVQHSEANCKKSDDTKPFMRLADGGGLSVIL